MNLVTFVISLCALTLSASLATASSGGSCPHNTSLTQETYKNRASAALKKTPVVYGKDGNIIK